MEMAASATAAALATYSAPAPHEVVFEALLLQIHLLPVSLILIYILHLIDPIAFFNFALALISLKLWELFFCHPACSELCVCDDGPTLVGLIDLIQNHVARSCFSSQVWISRLTLNHLINFE